MRVITAADLGLPAEEAEVLGSLSPKRDDFPLGKILGLWEQWVRELERGELWVREELESACFARDEIENVLAVVPGRIQTAVFDFVDALDQIYREWTVSSLYLAERKTESRWWWGRVPLRNAQRRYLFT